MTKLVGRSRERKTLAAAMGSSDPELVALYGRRRVGKTFLVREALGPDICFELTGMHRVALGMQLRNFSIALGDALARGIAPAVPQSWLEAFRQLRAMLEGLPKRKRKRVVFLDELPWLASRRSGFLSAFEHFWNSWASTRRDLVVIVCGSAASWMLNRLLRARGGLHNRVTRRIRLVPFTVTEARQLLVTRRVELDTYQLLELYMAFGGVPHYLKEIERGESAAQCIDRVCFAPDGLLRDEFGEVYASLFEKADRHLQIVRALASKRRGLTRNELLAATKLPSGGGTTETLKELEASGFVMRTPQFGLKVKDEVYRLADEHSLFHLSWIEKHRGRAEGVWIRKRRSPAWRAWSGYAFEGLCLKHADALRQALGISGVETEESTWQHRPQDDDEHGAQIDLLIDRRDRCINLCEMKFCEGEFVVDKAYARNLRNKREVFAQATKTRKALFTTLVTTHGVRANRHRDAVVDRTIEVDSLFI
ncbi:MAG: ATP-binding protein [Deltaproteobacteria bacterium]|nr:MAG: ATP-binding protein [Deltaproteobacteria bacterium]